MSFAALEVFLTFLVCGIVSFFLDDTGSSRVGLALALIFIFYRLYRVHESVQAISIWCDAVTRQFQLINQQMEAIKERDGALQSGNAEQNDAIVQRLVRLEHWARETREIIRYGEHQEGTTSPFIIEQLQEIRNALERIEAGQKRRI